MKRGEREREGKKETNKKRGTLCPAVFRVYSIFFFSLFLGGAKGGGGGCLSFVTHLQTHSFF